MHVCLSTIVYDVFLGFTQLYIYLYILSSTACQYHALEKIECVSYAQDRNPRLYTEQMLLKYQWKPINKKYIYKVGEHCTLVTVSISSEAQQKNPLSICTYCKINYL